ALLRRVDSKLTVEEARNRMLSLGAARKVGQRLAASTAHPTFTYAPGSKQQTAHHMSVLNALAWNFEHNTNPREGDLRWCERRASVYAFPERAVTAYNLDLSKRATAFLRQEIAVMQRVADSMRSRGPEHRAHVHIFFSAPAHPPNRRRPRDSE